MDRLNDHDLDLIDKYLADTLSEEEEVLFQQKITQADFKEELNQVQSIKAGITTFELRQKKKLLQAEEQLILNSKTKEPASKSKIFSFSNVLKIAALLIGLSLMAWWGTRQFNNDISGEDLFAQYFEPQKNTIAPIQKGSAEQSDLQQTFSYYENKEYAKAITGLEQWIAAEDNDDYRFYQANAMLAIGQTDQAIAILNELSQGKEMTKLKEANVKWYLALAYIQKEQNNEARILLNDLSTSSFYTSQAQTILEILH